MAAKMVDLQKANQAVLAVDRPALDDFSQRGKFCWVTIGNINLPCIIRHPEEKYCAVRMVEGKLVSKYLNYLHPDIYTYACIQMFFITDAEARLLNEINNKHRELQFGSESFTTKDLVVTLKDANKFYSFLEVCYSKLLRNGLDGNKELGYVRINYQAVVPYIVKMGNAYVPKFYFEGEMEYLKLKAVQLEHWDIAYLKFCCKVQDINNELFASEAFSVINLNDIKRMYPPTTIFEDYWPNMVMDSRFLFRKDLVESYNLGSWKSDGSVSQPAQRNPQAIWKSGIEQLKRKLKDYEDERTRLEETTSETKKMLTKTKENYEFELELNYLFQKELEQKKFEITEKCVIDFTEIMNQCEKDIEVSTKKCEEIKEERKELVEESKKINSGMLKKDLLCNICLELYIDPYVLDCHHSFCKACIDEWQKVRNKVCPVCREQFKTCKKAFFYDGLIDSAVNLMTDEERKQRAELIERRREGKSALPAKKRKIRTQEVQVQTQELTRPSTSNPNWVMFHHPQNSSTME